MADDYKPGESTLELKDADGLFREQMLRAYELAGIGTYEIDLARRIIRMSAQMARLLRASDHAMDWPLDEYRQRFLHPDDRDTGVQEARVAYETGAELAIEIRMVRGDGEVIWIRNSSSSRRNTDGAMIVIGVILEITATRASALALAASEALLLQFIRHTPAAVAMFDRDLRYLHASERWISDYKLDGHVIGRLHYEVFPDIPDRWKQIHQRALAGSVERCDEDPFPRADGTTEWLEWECRPWRAADGSIGGIIMFTQVITERKRSEERLRESEARFRALSESAPTGIYIRQDSFLTYANPAFERIFGYAPGETIGKDILSFVHPDDLAAVVPRMQQRVDGVPSGLRGVRKDGEVIDVEILGFGVDIDGRPAVVGNVVDVTERRRSEERLRESEARFRHLFESSLAGVYIAQDDKFVYASPSLEKIFGVAPGSLAGTPMYLPVHPDDLAMVSEQVRRRVSGEASVVHYELRAVQPDGTVVWLEVLGATMVHEGRPALFGNILDVTARKRAEEELQRSELRWRTFIEQAPVAIGVKREGVIVYANQKLRDLWGYPSLDAVVSRRADELWESSSHAEPRASYEAVARRQDGTTFPTHVEVVSVELPDGPARIAFLTDQTERRHAETAIREGVARYREIAETIDEVFWLRDPGTGRILYVSPAFERVWGRPVTEADRWPPAIHREDQSRIAARMEAGAYDETYRILRADGSIRWIRDRAYVVRDEVGEPQRVVGAASDITDQRSLEHQLRQSQKMEAIGVLAGGVAHDFNNLLAVILSYSVLLMAELNEGEPMYEDLREINLAGDRASRLTKQLLAFSRQQVFQPHVVDLNEVVASTEKMLRRLIGEDIELETVPANRLAKVEVDVGQMEQVLLNLAVNARDAMPDGGRLRIVVTHVRVDDAEAARFDVPAGRYVHLAVGDTGIGMDAATQARVFEPFFTTKDVGKGTGLGLSTVFGIVKQSNGFIAVESEPGRGTTFKIWLPFVAGAIEQPTQTGEVPAVRATDTILLVEDEDAVRRLAKTILTRRGFRVLEARSGGDALVICESHKGPIAVVLTDIVMPHMSGEVLVERVRAMRPGIRAVFMSGYPDKGEERRVGLAPEAFVQKPFTPDSLLQKILEVLAETRRGGA